MNMAQSIQEEGYFMTELPSNMMNIQQNNNVAAVNQSMGFNSNRVTNAFGFSPGIKAANGT